MITNKEERYSCNFLFIKREKKCIHARIGNKNKNKLPVLGLIELQIPIGQNKEERPIQPITIIKTRESGPADPLEAHQPRDDSGRCILQHPPHGQPPLFSLDQPKLSPCRSKLIVQYFSNHNCHKALLKSSDHTRYDTGSLQVFDPLLLQH